jgi:hypothetical protein
MNVSLQNLDLFVIYPKPNITYARLTFHYLTTQTEMFVLPIVYFEVTFCTCFNTSQELLSQAYLNILH